MKRYFVIISTVLLISSTPLIAQTKSWYFLIDAVSNSYENSLFSSSGLEVGYRPKGFPIIIGIGAGNVDFGSFQEYGSYYINTDLDYRYTLFKNKIARFKPFIGIKASYYFLGEVTIAGERHGDVDYSYLKNMITVGPTLGFDFYLGNIGAINFMYSPQYELSTGLVNRFSLGISRTL